MAIRVKWNGHQQEEGNHEDRKAEWPLQAQAIPWGLFMVAMVLVPIVLPSRRCHIAHNTSVYTWSCLVP